MGYDPSGSFSVAKFFVSLMKSDFGLLDMLLDPEAEKTVKIFLGKFSLDSKLTLRMEVGDSFHRFFGGHASAAININDFLKNFIGYGY